MAIGYAIYDKSIVEIKMETAAEPTPFIPRATSLDPLLVSWTRGLMWVTIVVAGFQLANKLLSIFLQSGALGGRPAGRTFWQTRQMWMTPEVLFAWSMEIGPYLLAVLAARACLQFRPRARVALIVAMWLWLAVHLVSVGSMIVMTVGSPQVVIYVRLGILQRLAEAGALPVIVLLFLARPAVRALFDSPRGFDPILTGLSDGLVPDNAPPTPERV